MIGGRENIVKHNPPHSPAVKPHGTQFSKQTNPKLAVTFFFKKIYFSITGYLS